MLSHVSVLVPFKWICKQINELVPCYPILTCDHPSDIDEVYLCIAHSPATVYIYTCLSPCHWKYLSVHVPISCYYQCLSMHMPFPYYFQYFICACACSATTVDCLFLPSQYLYVLIPLLLSVCFHMNWPLLTVIHASSSVIIIY